MIENIHTHQSLPSSKNTWHIGPLHHPSKFCSYFIALVPRKQIKVNRFIRYQFLLQMIFGLPTKRTRCEAIHGHGSPPNKEMNGIPLHFFIILSRDKVRHGLLEFIPNVVTELDSAD